MTFSYVCWAKWSSDNVIYFFIFINLAIFQAHPPKEDNQWLANCVVGRRGFLPGQTAGPLQETNGVNCIRTMTMHPLSRTSITVNQHSLTYNQGSEEERDRLAIVELINSNTFPNEQIYAYSLSYIFVVFAPENSFLLLILFTGKNS